MGHTQLPFLGRWMTRQRLKDRRHHPYPNDREGKRQNGRAAAPGSGRGHMHHTRTEGTLGNDHVCRRRMNAAQDYWLGSSHPLHRTHAMPMRRCRRHHQLACRLCSCVVARPQWGLNMRPSIHSCQVLSRKLY